MPLVALQFLPIAFAFSAPPISSFSSSPQQAHVKILLCKMTFFVGSRFCAKMARFSITLRNK
jgi:hypothetical protein